MLGVIGSIGFAVWVGNLFDSMAVGICVLVSFLWLLNGNPAPRAKRKGVSPIAFLLMLLGLMWLSGSSSEES